MEGKKLDYDDHETEELREIGLGVIKFKLMI